MNGMMKVAVMKGIGKMQLEKRPIPQIKAHEVLVKIEDVGICGSDIHYYENGRIGDYIVHPPFVLGHECAGTVVELGSAVSSLQKGDRVALEPGITCGTCEFCKSGHYNLCPEVKFFATPPVDGVFQEYVAHPSDMCFKLPDNVSSIAGALVEPLSVGFHAVNQGNAHFGQTAVVFGAGCIGLVTLLALKARGVAKIIVVDILAKRLEKAKELGAYAVVNGREQNVLEEVMKITHQAGADIAFETAGNEISTNQCIEVVKKGSTIVLVGYSQSGTIQVQMSLALDKELTFKTVFRYCNIYPMAIESIASGIVDIEKIVTNYFDLDDVQEAMDRSMNDKANIVKSVMRIN